MQQKKGGYQGRLIQTKTRHRPRGNLRRLLFGNGEEDDNHSLLAKFESFFFANEERLLTLDLQDIDPVPDR